MRHVSDRFTAILDANVLYPFISRDVLLSFSDAGLFRARWSGKITEEWRTNLLKRRPDLEDNINRTVARMDQAFPEAIVSNYEPLIQSLELPDPDDRHVLAAAIRCGAHIIVTENIQDFPSDYVQQWDIEVSTADDFLLSTLHLYPNQCLAAMRELRNRYRNPSLNPSDLIIHLTRGGLVSFAAELKEYVDSL